MSRAFGLSRQRRVAVLCRRAEGQCDVASGLFAFTVPVHRCAGAFLRETGVANVNTVRKTIEKLMELDIVYLHDGIYRFGNPFFREWVRRTYP